MDRVILAYLIVVSMVALARLSSIPEARWVLLANGLVVGLIWLVRRPGLGPLGRALADLYPICILLSLYGALDLLAGYGTVTTHDPLVQRWEGDLFGGQVARDWWRESPSRFWSTVLHGAYLSYYLVVPAAPIWFFCTGDRAKLRRVVLALMTVLLACYLVFIFFPVAGPYYEFERPSGAFLDNGAARLAYAILSGGSSYGAAFPSSHVAAALTAAGVTMLDAPKVGLLLLIPGLLMTVGVVYCQMHYGVDVVAGVLLAGAIVAMVSRYSHQPSTDG